MGILGWIILRLGAGALPLLAVYGALTGGRSAHPAGGWR
jgi:hypothetical protein